MRLLRTPFRSLSSAMVILLASATLGQASSPSRYKVVDLGTFGGNGSDALGINNSGQVTGWANVGSGERHAFLWQDGILTDLGVPTGYGYSYGFSINEIGQVIGESDAHGFLWDAVNGMHDLNELTQPPGQLAMGLAQGINDNGEVVGLGVSSRGYHWENGTVTDLNTLIGEAVSPAAINNSGHMAGRAVVPGGAFLYRDQTLESLGTLGGTYSGAVDLNENDQVVGWADLPGVPSHAFLWEEGVMTDIHTFPDSTQSSATAINESGQVVGWADRPDLHAFLWEDGVMTDLNDLISPDSGWLLSTGNDINDAGWIVGSGVNPDGEKHAFLLVPEPATFSLLALGGLLVARRRR
jgi:probable HAF family extracellular repeat protein